MTDFDDLTQTIEDSYGLRITSIVQMKTVLGLDTEYGKRFIWKYATRQDEPGRLRVLSQILATLSQSGLPSAPPLPNRAGDFISTMRGGKSGYLQPWLAGRHLDLRVKQERLTAIAAIANLHARTEGLPRLRLPHLNRGTLTARLLAKERTITRVWPRARAACPALTGVESELAEALTSSTLSYRAWLDMSGPARALHSRYVFCHRDLAPHNLLWSEYSRCLSMIDFDHAGLDDPLADVMQLANHSVFLADLAPGHFHDIVEVYGRMRTLDPAQEDVLWQLLRFPDVLIRAVTEWVRQGCTAEGKSKVLDCMQRERAHFRIWLSDYEDRYHLRQ